MIQRWYGPIRHRRILENIFERDENNVRDDLGKVRDKRSPKTHYAKDIPVQQLLLEIGVRHIAEGEKDSPDDWDDECKEY